MILAAALVVAGVIGLITIVVTGRRRGKRVWRSQGPASRSQPPASSKRPEPARAERRPISLIPPAPDQDPDASGPRKPVVVASGFDDDEFSTSFQNFTVTSAVRTDPGRVRGNNEDAFLSLPDHYLYAVADGMGGEVGGEIASTAALESVSQALLDRPSAGRIDVRISRRGAELVAAIVDANRQLRERIALEPNLRGMGTTIVVLKFSPSTNRAYVAHVGDSRAYLIRNGEIRQLTKDHTYGEIAGARGGMASRLAWALGIDTQVNVEIQALEPQVGDKYLLCSDGLTKMVQAEELLEAVLMQPNLETCVKGLVDAANQRGGVDNITVLLAGVMPPTYKVGTR